MDAVAQPRIDPLRAAGLARLKQAAFGPLRSLSLLGLAGGHNEAVRPRPNASLSLAASYPWVRMWLVSTPIHRPQTWHCTWVPSSLWRTVPMGGRLSLCSIWIGDGRCRS